MAAPKIINAHCNYRTCNAIREGTYYESDEYYDHYLCEKADDSGVGHTFAVLNEKGKKSEEKVKRLGILAGIILVYKGIEVIRYRQGDGEKKVEAIKEIVDALLKEGVDKENSSLIAESIVESKDSYSYLFDEDIAEGIVENTDEIVEAGTSIFSRFMDFLDDFF